MKIGINIVFFSSRPFSRIQSLCLQLQVTSNQTSSSPSLIQSLSPTSPTQLKAPPSPILSTSGAAGHHHGKHSMRVSFKDRIKSMQRQESKAESRKISIPEGADMNQRLLMGGSAKASKPSAAQSLKERLRSLGHLPRSDDQLKPWSKLKLATVISVGGSYTSLNNSLNEDSPILEQTKKSRLKTSIPADLNLNSLASITPPPISSAPPTTVARGTMFQPPSKVFSCSTNVEKTCVSDSEVVTKKELPPPPTRVRIKPKPITITDEPKSYKCYMSIDDLSPEYSGLPFVKRLKILNERQKLAELESAMQTRSLSLDCTDSNSSNTGYQPVEQLSRSKSEASGIASTRSKSASSAAHPKRSSICGSIPLSPESNETPERRQLKSILKKLSEDKLALDQRQGIPNRDLKKLMRAQTVEGYVARHSKFAKSVTFNRNTLSSPPSSANFCESIEERTLFPIPSAQKTTTVTTAENTSASEDSSLTTVAESTKFSPTKCSLPSTVGDSTAGDEDKHALVISNNGYYDPSDPLFYANGNHQLSSIDDSASKGSLSAFGAQRKLIKGKLIGQFCVACKRFNPINHLQVIYFLAYRLI